MKVLLLHEGSSQQIARIRRLLLWSLHPSTRLYRLSLVRPFHFRMTHQFVEKIDDSTRQQILQRRMAYQLFQKDSEQICLHGGWNSIKTSPEIFKIRNLNSLIHQKLNQTPQTLNKTWQSCKKSHFFIL